MRVVLLALAAAIVWGLWWIPIRYLQTLGLTGVWSGVVMNAGAALVTMGWALRGGRMLPSSRRALLGSAFVGVAVMTFATAINYTDVARAILLFYIAPAWSKIIEWAFLGQRWRHSATVAIVFCLVGAFLILGGEMSWQAVRLGDALALLSGMSWACGAALIFTSRSPETAPQLLITLVIGAAIGVVFGLVAGDTLEIRSAATLPVGLMLGVLFVFPCFAITLWAAQRLRPAVVTYILTAEIVSAVVSSALLLDEPFGAMQALGALLIILAALSEIMGGERDGVSRSISAQARTRR